MKIMAISHTAHYARKMAWVRGKRFADLPWIVGGEKIDYAIREVCNGRARATAYFTVIAEDGLQIERCAIITRAPDGMAQVKCYEIAGAEYTHTHTQAKDMP